MAAVVEVGGMGCVGRVDEEGERRSQCARRAGVGGGEWWNKQVWVAAVQRWCRRVV